MITRFFSLQWKQFFRSSYWQKSMALNIVMVFFALYFILMFLGLGFGLYPLLKDKFPTQDPLLIVNGYLFYWLLGDLLMRFFFQKLPVMNIKPLLTLPIKRSSILHYVLGKSAISFFNFLPLFTVIPFGVILLINGYGAAVVLTWMFLIITLTLITNFLNFIIESKSAETELSFLPILAFSGILFGLNYFNIISFNDLVGSAVNSITANSLLLIIPIGMLILLYYANFTLLKQKLYIDRSLKAKTEIATTTDMAWTRRFGSVAHFLQLDLKLLWRNKRPRSSVFIVAIGLLYGLIFYPNPVYQNMVSFYVFVGIFVTGIFMINFGQFIPAWDSGYYKLLMSQNIKYKEYLNSKYTLMMMSAILMFVISIPYVYFGWKVLVVHFAAMIYNIGVNTHVLLYGGSFNRKKIDLTQRAAFNYQGTGAVQWIIGFPLMFIPMIFFYIPYKFINFEAGIATLIILGIVGIVFHEKIMKGITKSYINTKYKMINAFDQDS
ncbi:hypothetical protein JBL43_04510 [Aureibaculum sp. A20]|uniref:ABC transporter permease n=1 Tax=Aureibaculum flavum TaxID=2795986 RepID=A0ABS0WND5_9FLAO|nr:DUF5687 family protein [Aureibaculum flavum]MBJ2173485.1 hypothetical protein [Aureibaculum flavum]